MNRELVLKINELMGLLEKKHPQDEKVVVGLDGFVDEIVHVVDKRRGPNEFDRLRTMREYGERIIKAAGLSTNIEMVTVQQKLGGNGPILCNALSTYGLKSTYIGAVGYPYIEKVFEPMAENVDILSIANPGHTDAVEFEDGKIMVGKHFPLLDVNWDNIKKVIGVEKLKEIIGSSKLLGLVNWTMLAHMDGILKGLLEEVLPNMENNGSKKYVFFDLADPEKRTSDDIKEALELIKKFGKYYDVILGLNLKEATEIAEVLGLSVPRINDGKNIDLERLVSDIGKELKLYSLVVHPTIEAAAYMNEKYYHVDGPFTPKPKLTTGAGDNFNAGFCLGQILDLDPEMSLLMGVATSGFYVRNAKSPTFEDLRKFLLDWTKDNI